MTTEEKIIKGKLEMLELGSRFDNVIGACRTPGYSREKFHGVKKL